MGHEIQFTAELKGGVSLSFHKGTIYSPSQVGAMSAQRNVWLQKSDVK